jgi:HK97 family phage prohead protease
MYTGGMKRAYSVLTLKRAGDEDGRRLFSGIATTPNPDRAGDIVEPMGAEFKLPIALLWQHDAGSPIGWVQSAKVSADGIQIEGEIARMDEPGKLKDRLDEAWQSMKVGLVRGLSIGFKPTDSKRIGDTFSYRYLKWLWLELSAVTIPMNGDASIEAIKAADMANRGAAFSARPIVRLEQAPGVTGDTIRRKGVIYL